MSLPWAAFTFFCQDFEHELNDVCILDDVRLTLLAILARLLDLGHARFRGDGFEITKGNDLSFDEAATGNQQ